VVSKLHVERTPDDEEEFILGFMLMPHESAGELDELDVLPVELTNDFRIPVGGEEGELLCEVDGVHDEPESSMPESPFRCLTVFGVRAGGDPQPLEAGIANHKPQGSL
jgi:hypothetical protein